MIFCVIRENDNRLQSKLLSGDYKSGPWVKWHTGREHVVSFYATGLHKHSHNIIDGMQRFSGGVFVYINTCWMWSGREGTIFRRTSTPNIAPHAIIIYITTGTELWNTLRHARRNGYNFVDGEFQFILLNEMCECRLKFHSFFLTNCPIEYRASLIQVMALCRLRYSFHT